MAKPPQVSPVAASSGVAMTLYGVPGSGKTTFIGSKGERVLILRPPTDHVDSILGSGADQWVLRDWNSITEVEEYMRHDPLDEYDWIWLDSISQFQYTGLDHIWENVIDAKPHRADGPVDKGEYGINMSRIGRFLRMAIGEVATGKINFGVTAHSFYEPSPMDEDTLVWMPWVQGRRMSPMLCGLMHVVAYLEILPDDEQPPFNRLHIHPNERFYAKDQFKAIPRDGLAEPTLPQVEELIAKARGAGSSKTKAKTKTKTKTKTRQRRK